MFDVKFTLKTLLTFLALTGVAQAAPAVMGAAAYPEKPIRFVAAFAAGGSIDLLARLFAQKLTQSVGQQVVVDNRPGAGGSLSAEIVARAPADGYTIYICAPSLVVNAALYAKIPYDPLRDFSPVTLLASVQNVLVAYPGLPVKSVKDLVALAKSKPGQINYASTGSGSSGHLVMEMFRSQTGINLLHVPYKVIGQTTTDLISGQVSLWFPTIPGALPHIRGARMRALAVAGARRSSALAEIPTVAEAAALPGFDATTWYAVLAPAGVNRGIIGKLNTAFVTALRAQDTQERLAAQGIESIGSTPEQLAAHIRSEMPKWAKVVKDAGVRAD